MIPDRDYYADKDGKLTTDASQAVMQIGVKGCFLDERIARRYGITDTLVSVDEPNALRRVTGRNKSSVEIIRAEDKQEEPQRPAEAAEPIAEPEAEEPKAEAKKPAAKKEKKK